MLREIQQHPDGHEARQQRRAAIADERQRQALRRQEAQRDADVDQRRHGDEQREADGGVELEALRVARDAEAAPDEEGEEDDEDERADEAELLADDGEDEVRMRLGEEEELLPPVAEAEAAQAARAEGDERLHGLESLPQRIGLGVQEREEAIAPIRGAVRQRGRGRNQHDGKERDALPRDAGREDHPGHDEDDGGGGAEVFEDDEAAEERQDERERQERGGELVDALLAPRDVPRHEEDEHRLGELGRLHLEEVHDDDPAMLAVDDRLEEDDDEADEDEREQRRQDARIAQDRKVEVQQKEHGDGAGEEPDALPRDEVVRIVGADLLRRDDGRGGVDHHHAEEDDEHGAGEEPGVVGEFPAHSARTSSSKCSPRCSKFRY